MVTEVNCQHHAPGALPPVPTEEEAEWTPWSAWTGVENHMWEARDYKINSRLVYLTFIERSS